MLPNQPWRVSTSAAVRSVIPAPSVVIPARSSRTFAVVRESVSVAAAVITAAAAAASSQNPVRQPTAVASPAPASGPTMTPAPRAAPQTAVACVRAVPERNVRPIEPRPAARMPAPATPCSTRAATSISMVGASAPRALAPASSPAPHRRMRR